MRAPLPLRDVHEGIAPPWWPPAPGWWWVLAGIVLVIAVAGWRWHRARRRRAAVVRLFDVAVDAAVTPAGKVAAMSELLRRAARRSNPDADTLEGEDWVRLLDEGLPQPVFASGAGALLRDGGFRAEVPMQEVEALRPVARARYLAWMQDA